MVRVDVAALNERLAPAQSEDWAAWEQIRRLLLLAVGETTFEIWLARLQLIAVDRDGSLVIVTPEATRGWVRTRFGRSLERCAAQAGCIVRFGAEHERLAFALRPDAPPVSTPTRADNAGQAEPDATTTATTPHLTPALPPRPTPTSPGMGVHRSSDLAPDVSGDWRTERSSAEPSYASDYESSYPHAYIARREVS
jgi:DnaA N-terminal domain